MTTLKLTPVIMPQPQALETTVTTSYGLFSAQMWPMRQGWLAFVVYYIGEDVQIHRTIPAMTNQVDAATWVQQAFEAGPQFILPLLKEAL